MTNPTVVCQLLVLTFDVSVVTVCCLRVPDPETVSHRDDVTHVNVTSSSSPTSNL